MKLSETMLNFLGYMHEQEVIGRTTVNDRICVGLASFLGIRTAVLNGLIEEASFNSYRLTDFGRQVGAIGRSMRSDTRPGEKIAREAFVKRGQEVINIASRSGIPTKDEIR